MEVSPKRSSRRSIRLKEYDYSQGGGYFVTMCTQGRRHVFGEVADGEMILNEFGKIVQAAWDDLPDHYPGMELDAFVVMPNHVHGIVLICGGDLAGAIHELPLRECEGDSMTQTGKGVVIVTDKPRIHLSPWRLRQPGQLAEGGSRNVSAWRRLDNRSNDETMKP